MRRSHVFGAVLVILALAAIAPAYAQQTTGNIVGRILDEQNAAVPGVTVTATNIATGFKRAVVSDAEGLYRFTALPVGRYDMLAELTGFASIDRKGIEVTVGQTFTIDFQLKVAKMAETVTVTGETPLVEATSSSVGGVVDVTKIESLPLNGRQFANLAMTIPGVGMGFHSDPTKSTQYSPQIGGGNGRNVNYQIDGGDNNDDTVGGLLQLFPLEAIQEFNMVTQRYKAEYGRSNGGVMSIVTKGGTNQFKGSWFTLGRDKTLNARTETEKLDDVEKQYYRRYQFGGSFGGPIVENKAHFFAAVERTQQDTKQAVSTYGLFPDQDGVYDIGYRETLFTGKMTANVTQNQYLSVRYGRNSNAQPYGADPHSPPSNWADSDNKFNSINVNHNWILGGSKLNEFIFQYADFANHITARTAEPYQSFPNHVTVGASVNAPQTTIQHKFQFRDDFSWHKAGGWGLGHDFKTGANFIYEPRLYVTFNSGILSYQYDHLTNDLNGPITDVGKSGGDSSANIPTKQVGVYFQDDWRVHDRLTLNLGLRYDLNTGFAIDQSKNPNFVLLQQAGAAGKLRGFIGLEDWGLPSREDYNNVQPRLGFAWDVRGDGRDVVRGGWGVYYDFSYTNASILFAAINANGIGAGSIFEVSDSNGIKNPDGSFFKVSDPISNIASQNEAGALPMGSHVASPRILQPYTQQTSAGWSHQLSPTTVIDVDYVHIVGHDLGLRWRLNTRVGGASSSYPRRLDNIVPGLAPSNLTFDISSGRSRFDSINVGLRRRMDKHIQFNAWYSLSSAKGTGGNGGDELTNQWVQDATNPFADVQFGPSGRTDARHRITLSGVIEMPGGISVSPIFRYRSALPVNIYYGYDNNQNGENNDIYTEAYAFGGFDSNHNPILKDLGPCKTINCGRGAGQAVFNLRVSKVFAFSNGMHIEAIAEVFNLFNALTPGDFNSDYYEGSKSSHTVNADFMRPLSYAGDFQMPEQRVGQIGFRFTF